MCTTNKEGIYIMVPAWWVIRKSVIWAARDHGISQPEIIFGHYKLKQNHGITDTHALRPY
jgi:hypothetical protein